MNGRGVLKRRSFLISCAATSLGGLSFRTEASDVLSALTESNLVYLSPVTSSGGLSSCQAEVWYVMLGADVLVCTASGSWRAQAPAKGLSNTRLWAGDRGVWRNGQYQSLPSTLVSASSESDPSVIEAALTQFGLKYAGDWDTWGQRFRSGLADGSRTMLRYRIPGISNPTG